MSDWTRKGPLADLPPARGDRRSREPADDGRVRDFGNWERRGPLPPPERPTTREGSYPPSADGGRSDSFRGGRRLSPAAWGEGQGPPRHDGSRPPRGDRPERAPTAAEKDMQWRASMRPDPPARASPSVSRDGSEAPTSPAAAAPAGLAPSGRPKLNLQKRTVSDATDAVSPSITGDAKSSPFGAARPIDTTQREREVEEKRQQQLKAKREAEEKAREERRLAKEAAEKAEAEAEAKEAAIQKAEEEATKTANAAAAGEAAGEAAKTEQQPADDAAQNGAGAAAAQDMPIRSRGPREGAPPIKTRATESGNWRQSAGELRSPRGGSGPRRGGNGPGRGSRYEGARGGPRANGSQSTQQPATPTTADPGTPVQEEDGWTTVPNKSRRGTRA